ncbi:MAG TPA: hypothetical protein VFV74_06975 [Burkholderiales bacterium]|nr:hypothetical protein [Burkholderiales bacterium]
MRTFAAVAALIAAPIVLPALAQGPGDGPLRVAPPAPPEREAVAPDKPAARSVPEIPDSGPPASLRSRRGEERCGELRGVLREQCLLEHQGSAAGATSVPHPLAAPPPQNPR